MWKHSSTHYREKGQRGRERESDRHKSMLQLDIPNLLQQASFLPAIAAWLVFMKAKP